MPLKWTNVRPVASERSVNHSASGGLFTVDARGRSDSARQPARGATQRKTKRTKNAPYRIRMRSVGLSHQVRVNTVKNRLTRSKQAVRWPHLDGHAVTCSTFTQREEAVDASPFSTATRENVGSSGYRSAAARRVARAVVACGQREGCLRRGASRRHHRSVQPC